MSGIRLDGVRVRTLHDEIVATIPCQKPGYRNDLAALSFGAVFTVYMNWADRLVPTRPRRVVFLDGFWSDEAWRHKDAVLEISKKVESGTDLTGHLSSLVDFRGYSPSRYDAQGRLITSKWRDKDFALNAYNVHHLHFVERPARTKELLFVEFTRDVAVFVMVGDHDSFDGKTWSNASLKLVLAMVMNSRVSWGRHLVASRQPKGMSWPVPASARWRASGVRL